MKELIIGTRLIQIASVFFIMQNFYFGWNEKPMSELENYADNIVIFLFYIGLGFYLLPLIKQYEIAVKENKKNRFMLKKKFTENFVKIMFENITDKSNVPYYEHLRIVAENAQLKAIKDAILSNDSLLKNTEEYYIVGLLHDTLEDIPYVTNDLIKGIYGKKVADAIVAITKLKGEEYQTYLNRVKSNLIATKVKIEDLKHNMDITRLLNTTEKDIERIIKYKDALSFLQTK